MKVIEINPYTVMKRFPSHRETIKHFFRGNRSFQTLCSDYRQCARALHYWNKSDLREALQRREEYETLLHELESEILLILERSKEMGTEEA